MHWNAVLEPSYGGISDSWIRQAVISRSDETPGDVTGK